MSDRGSRNGPQGQRGSMTCRIALAVALAAGMVLGTAGVAAAASALSPDFNASAVQYGQAGTTEVLGQAAPPPAGALPPPAGVRGASDSGPGQVLGAGAEGENGAQAPRQLQVAQQKSSLPFTGYATVPLLLSGVLLLACGLALRRRTGSLAARR